MTANWAEMEFKTIDVGDKRLGQRLAAQPTASIPTACGGWAETQAAYRFLSQDAIGLDDILAPHGHARRRVCAHTRWYCACKTRRNWISMASRRQGWSP